MKTPWRLQRLKNNTFRPMPRGAVVVALLTVAGLLLIGIEFSRRQGLYWYDVGQDHDLRFSRTRTTTIPLDVRPNGFTVPQLTTRWDTAILRLSVSSTLDGAWFEPSLSLSTEDWSSSQFVERNVQGYRHFLFPQGSIASGDRVTIQGKHVTLDPQDGELILFHNPTLHGKRVLVLAPHPDDAEIAAFGLYSNHDSYVVSITAGDYVDGRYRHIHTAPNKQRELRGEMRTWDSMTVPLMAGVDSSRLANLGYSNSSLSELHRNREQPSSKQQELFLGYRRGALLSLAGAAPKPTWENLVADLAALITTIDPDVIIAPHPTLDAAPDHQLTTRGLLQALERIADERTPLFLYTNHHVLTEYYPFGPANSHVIPPPWLTPTPAIPSVYSFELSREDQVKKLFALEAMHDLRPAPEKFLGGPTNRFLTRVMRSMRQISADPLGTYSYFRRAARPNELFFVYTADERDELTH